MANLEAKSYISTTELAVLIFVTCVGSQIFLAPQGLIEQAGANTWISVLAAGLLYFLAACCMVWLAMLFRDESIVEYAPRIWGRWLGAGIILWFAVLFFMQIAVILQGAGKVITFFMFDRTPPEVISMTFLFLCVYCAVQDIGTILRIQQFLLIVSYSLFYGVWMVTILSFQPENILPIFPLNLGQLSTVTLQSWTFYSGYEMILLLYPLLYRKTSFLSVVKWLGAVFSSMAFLYTTIIIIIIGVMTAASAQNTPYPALIVIRSVEIPGTFIERLESYLLIFWIPVVFDTLAMMLYVVSATAARHWGHKDHRPWVLIMTPCIYFMNAFLEYQSMREIFNQIMLWLGLLFSFGVIPLTLLLSRKRRREGKNLC